MAEIGADIPHEESKTLERYLRGPADYIVTVCPVFRGVFRAGRYGGCALTEE